VKVNVYHLEIEYHDRIEVEGQGADSHVRIGESVLSVDVDATRPLLAAVTELHHRLHPEEREEAAR